MVQCVLLKREAPGLDRAPYPGELGRRSYEIVSKEAWARWLQRLGGDGGGSVGPVFTHRADRGEDFLPRRVLEEISLGALRQALEDVLIAVVGGHDEDARLGIGLEHALHHRDAVAFGHAQIE